MVCTCESVSPLFVKDARHKNPKRKRKSASKKERVELFNFGANLLLRRLRLGMHLLYKTTSLLQRAQGILLFYTSITIGNTMGLVRSFL